MIDEIESFLASGTKTCPKLSSRATVYNYIPTEDIYDSRTIIGLLGSYRS